MRRSIRLWKVLPAFLMPMPKVILVYSNRPKGVKMVHGLRHVGGMHENLMVGTVPLVQVHLGEDGAAAANLTMNSLMFGRG